MESTIETNKVKSIEWGSGRYSATMKELYNDALNYVLEITPEQSERLARSYGAELGRLRPDSEDKVRIAFGKLKKDGQITLRDTLKYTALLKMTTPLALGLMIGQLNEMTKYGLIYGNTKIDLNKDHRDWLCGVVSSVE